MKDKTTGIQEAAPPCVGKFCISEVNSHDLVHVYFLPIDGINPFSSFLIKTVKNAFSSQLAYKNTSFILHVIP